MNNRIKRFDPTNLTANVVLEKIQEMSEKQKTARPLGIDSIALMLRLNLGDLHIFLEELQREGHIVLRPSRHAGKGVPKLTDAGTLILLTN